MEEGKKKYKIGNGAVATLIALASLVDILTLIPFVGTFIGWLFWVLVGVYFWKVGLGFVNWRRLAPSIVSALIELFPFAQEFPTIVAAMVIILTLTRIQEKTGLSLLAPLKKGQKIRLPEKIEPLYSGGKGRVRTEGDD